MVKGVPKAFPACPYAGAVAGWGEALVKPRPAGEGPNHCWDSAAASKAPGHRGCLGFSKAHMQQEGLHCRGSWAGEGANLPWSAVPRSSLRHLCAVLCCWCCWHHLSHPPARWDLLCSTSAAAKWKPREAAHGQEPARASSHHGAKRGNVSRPWKQPSS